MSPRTRPLATYAYVERLWENVVAHGGLQYRVADYATATAVRHTCYRWRKKKEDIARAEALIPGMDTSLSYSEYYIQIFDASGANVGGRRAKDEPAPKNGPFTLHFGRYELDGEMLTLDGEAIEPVASPADSLELE